MELNQNADGVARRSIRLTKMAILHRSQYLVQQGVRHISDGQTDDLIRLDSHYPVSKHSAPLSQPSHNFDL